ncbi:MAG: TM2 domain-containing protein [Methylovulum sp.]|nr:TM2 domain-containing protein [Methylovulum sp.]
MIGTIESYDEATQTGTISSEGKLFAFQSADWLSGAAPEAGDDVRFTENEGKATQIDLVGAYLDKPEAVKYKYLAAVLAVLLGWLGAHRIYLGEYRVAFAQMAISVVLGLIGLLPLAMAWGFIEGFLIFGGHINKDAKGRPFK